MKIESLIPQNNAFTRNGRRVVVTASIPSGAKLWIERIAKEKNQSVSFVAGAFLEYLYIENTKPDPPQGERE